MLKSSQSHQEENTFKILLNLLEKQCAKSVEPWNSTYVSSFLFIMVRLRTFLLVNCQQIIYAIQFTESIYQCY